jgi:hypothetical protein
LLPTVVRKKPVLAFDELERVHDLRAKLLGRRQLAADGVDDNCHACASEAIEKCETFG